MEKLQVLLATVHQTDLTIAEKMNLHCSTVIANQADREEVCSRGPVKMITTATRGVGLNRNLALLAADGDILLFADDDVVYNDGMEEAVAPGSVITLQAGCRHTVIADTELVLIEVQLGKEISREDKQKFPLEY